MLDDPDHLRPATQDDIIQSLAFALRFDGRRRVHDADGFMARIVAERLVEHLRVSGFMVMKKPSGRRQGRRSRLHTGRISIYECTFKLYHGPVMCLQPLRQPCAGLFPP